jgi:predicted permease
MQTILPLLGIYLFILIGYFSKRFFKDDIHEKTLVILSIYFLQPIMTFWGLTYKPLTFNDIHAPAIYLLISVIALTLSFVFAKLIFDNQKDISIASAASIIGNTGNLGIPLGIVLIGEESVLYTSLINLMNVFIVYTIGVFFYSRSNHSIKESLLNILKLPAIWVATFAIGYNLLGFQAPAFLEQPLIMGAYATMVIQLIIFGVYLASVQRSVINYKLLAYVSSIKFIAIPMIGIAVLQIFPLPPILSQSVMLEIIVPLAVMNVNLASLYDCKPQTVAFLTLSTSLFFLLYLALLGDYFFR